MFAHEFMRNAFLAGSLIALACGLVGYFVVLRTQVFAGDAFSHVAFTGALAAAAVGIDVRLGLFAATILAAVGLGLLGERSRADDVVIGSLFSWILGLGVLFLSIFTATASASNGTAAVRVLFGSIFGLSMTDARIAAAIAAAGVLGLLAIARPLLFSSIDTEVARGVGVPVRGLGIVFLVLLAIVAAEATQAIGALLLLGLLAAPGGAAQLITSHPWKGVALSGALAVGAMWVGLSLSYSVPSLPPSSAVIAVAAVAYLVAVITRKVNERRGLRVRRLSAAPSGPAAGSSDG